MFLGTRRLRMSSRQATSRLENTPAPAFFLKTYLFLWVCATYTSIASCAAGTQGVPVICAQPFAC